MDPLPRSMVLQYLTSIGLDGVGTFDQFRKYGVAYLQEIIPFSKCKEFLNKCDVCEVTCSCDPTK